jgi:ABC-type nitrate/sulfonate/bicarbonate transport system permease component
MSDVRATGVPGGVDDVIPELLLKPPPRPWYWWLVSDRAARYTARVAFVLVWQWAGTTFEEIPAPTETIEFLIEEFQRGEVWPNIGISLMRAVIALSVVLVLGISIGIAMARWWRVRYFLTDLILVGITLPAFIWALLVVMWWGFSNIGPITVCILSATPQLVVNTFSGATATPGKLLAMSDAFHVPERRQFRWLTIPSMMEYIAAGFRSAVLAGWGAVLLVEWFGNDKGVGFRAHYWYDARSFDGMMAWGLVMMIIILAFDRIVMDRVVAAARRWRIGTQEWSG